MSQLDLPTLLDKYDILSTQLKASPGSPRDADAILAKMRDIVAAALINHGVEYFGVELAAWRGQVDDLQKWRALFADPAWAKDQDHAAVMIARIDHLLTTLELSHVR